MGFRGGLGWAGLGFGHAGRRLREQSQGAIEWPRVDCWAPRPWGSWFMEERKSRLLDGLPVGQGQRRMGCEGSRNKGRDVSCPHCGGVGFPWPGPAECRPSGGLPAQPSGARGSSGLRPPCEVSVPTVCCITWGRSSLLPRLWAGGPALLAWASVEEGKPGEAARNRHKLGASDNRIVLSQSRGPEV